MFFGEALTLITMISSNKIFFLLCVLICKGGFYMDQILLSENITNDGKGVVLESL